MSTQTTYTPPSRAELADRMRTAQPKMVLYRGGPEWFRFEFGGINYYIPPDMPGNPPVAHPTLRHADGTPQMVPATGRLEVGTRFGILYDKPSDVARGQMKNRGFGAVKGEASEDIVMFAVENHGVAGVVWLEGNESDALKIAASRKAFHKYRKVRAEAECQARDAFLANWQKQPGNQGKPLAAAPRPTEAQSLAREYLDATHEEVSEGKAYRCKKGCLETDSLEAYERHLRVAHGETPEGDAIEEPVKRKPGRPPNPKVQPEG